MNWGGLRTAKWVRPMHLRRLGTEAGAAETICALAAIDFDRGRPVPASRLR